MIQDLIVAVDLGGTQIRVALCDARGNILNRIAQPARAADGVEAVFARIVAKIRAVTSDWSRVRGIGLGAPGTVDPWRGVILEAPNLAGMIDFPMRARLENELRVPVFVGNDANLAALGEQRFGAGRGVANLIYITISTGIGGGIIANNRLFLGARGFAGEVGHQTLEANGPRCNCGNIGCLEVLAAGPAIARAARDALRAGRDSQMRALIDDDVERITGTLVTQAAHAGDALAREIFDRAGFYIGLGLVGLQHNFDTQLFVLGGGVAINAWDFIFPTIQETFERYAMPSMRSDVRIVPAQLGDDAGLLGVVALVNERDE
ncbi:MAG: ROK family protein [Anaerolineales bacterium]|nr:ROK family protein [Anaerolineales bacterium]